MSPLKTVWIRARNDFLRLWHAGVAHIGFSQWINQFVYVVQRIVLSRIMGAEQIGHIAVATASLNLIRLPAAGGIFTAVTKLMAESQRDPAKEREVMGSALIVNLTTALVTSAITWWILARTGLVPDAVANRILRVMVPFLPVLILSESFRSALLGQRRMRTAGLAMTISALAGMGLIVVFAWKWQIPGWTVAQVAGFFLTLALVLYPLRSCLSLRWNRAVGRRLLRIGVFAFLGQLMGSLVLQFDTLAISGLLGDAKTTGVYNTATLVAHQLIAIPGPILIVAFPIIAQNRDDPKKLKRGYNELSLKLFLLTGCVSVIAAIPAEPLFKIMGPEFAASAWPFRILLIGFVSRTLYILDNTYLDALGRTDLTFASGIFGVAATISLNLSMIPRWGMLGAAWATAISSVISLAVRRIVTYWFIFRLHAVR